MCFSEKLIRRLADDIVLNGYKDVGYEYLVIDDCWLANERDPNGELIADPKRFPKGIKALADYVRNIMLLKRLYIILLLNITTIFIFNVNIIIPFNLKKKFLNQHMNLLTMGIDR